DAARREFQTDVVVLRAIVDFYTRHRQTPAVNILLDRASNEARRALAAGRFVPAQFELLAGCYELRGKKDASRAVLAPLDALRARPSGLRGGDVRATNPELDDLLAPELMSAPLRALLARAGDALDAGSPIDLRALRATPIGP